MVVLVLGVAVVIVVVIAVPCYLLASKQCVKAVINLVLYRSSLLTRESAVSD